MKINTTAFIRYMALMLIIFSVMDIKAQNIIYEQEDSIFIEKTIATYQARNYRIRGERVIDIAKGFTGKDYVASTLDSYNNEPLFISTTKLDCTTFVETVLAIALCNHNEGFIDFCKNLELIRYRNGKRNGYTSRLHYISWWVDDTAKQSLINEIETTQHTARQELDLSFMSCQPEKYRHLNGNKQRIDEIVFFEKPYRGIEIKYIPKENIGKIDEAEIKDGDIIAIVTSIEGLDVSHIGFACWQKGELHMIHASSAEEKVIFDPTSLETYLAKRKSHLGIRVFRAH